MQDKAWAAHRKLLAMWKCRMDHDRFRLLRMLVQVAFPSIQGPAMTLDLESLRDALESIQDVEASLNETGYASHAADLLEAGSVVACALAELTARRARDVEALVAALREITAFAQAMKLPPFGTIANAVVVLAEHDAKAAAPDAPAPVQPSSVSTPIPNTGTYFAQPPAPTADGAGELDAVAKAIADVIGHGMREKCIEHARAAIAALRQKVACSQGESA